MGEQNESGPPGGAVALRDRIAELEASESACRSDEEALRDTAARFRSLVEVTSDWVWEIDEHSRYTYSNPRIRELLGYEPGEVLGKTPFDLVPPEEAGRVSAIFRDIAARQEPFSLLENTNRHKDGHLVVLESSGVPLYDAQGRFRGYRGMDRDITERRRAEERLRASEQRYRDLVEVTADLVWEIDPNGVYTFVGPQSRELLGYEPQELVGQTILYRLPPEDVPYFEALFRSILEERRPVRFLENRNLRKDGTLVYLESSAVPFYDARGRLVGYRGIDRDISRRKRAEEQLRQSEGRLQDLVSVSSDLVWETDATGHFTYLGPREREITGYEPQERMGRSIIELVAPERRAELGAVFRAALEQPRPLRFIEAGVARRDGTLAYLETSAVPFYDARGRLAGYRGVTRDISARKQAEEERERLLAENRRQREFLERVLEVAPVGIAFFEGPEHRLVLANPAFTEVYRGVAGLVGRTAVEVFPEARLGTPTLDHVYETGEPHHAVDEPVTIYRDGQGQLGYASYDLVPLFEKGRVEGILLVGQETTQFVLARRRMEHLAAEAHRRAAELTAVLDSMVDAVLVTDGEGRITLANKVARELMRLRTPEGGTLDSMRAVAASFKMRDVRGRPVSPEQFALARALRGETVALEDLITTDPTTGRERDYRVSAAPIRSSTGQIVGAVTVIRDVTELVELERLKDQFVTVAAHELKTPVAVMKGYAQMLLREDGRMPDARRRMLAAIDRGSDRIARIVQDLVDISRLQLGGLSLARERIDLPDLARQVVGTMATTTRKHRIRVTEAEPAIVQGDRDRLEQVLRGLLDNAIKYSPQGGDIDVEVVTRDREAIVSVRDHGVGIPKNRQARVFERFYRAHAGTPYDFGGMGVGLYIAREIVARQGGRVWFESEEGKGSTFHFSLPLAQESATPSEVVA